MKRHVTSTTLFALIMMLVMLTGACGQKELVQPDTVTGSGGQVEDGAEGTPDNTAGEEQPDSDANSGNAEQQPEGNTNSGVTRQPEAQPDAGAAQQEKRQIKVYVTDDELIDLIEQDAEISFDSEETKLKAAFAALAQSKEEGKMSLWNKIELLDAKFDNGAAELNIHMPDEARLGSSGEVLAVDAIQKTMFQFVEVTSLNILVDGEAVESLMGHVELGHPFKKQ
ncbi:GerMN domain-containing protein [Paenibacillus sp. GCM10027626]|uniref:GerMN domain-containing protein n=1 Tax=Paenibacillus sp. GCM10027626 TaxID=3273411 RepID=UPI0036388B12